MSASSVMMLSPEPGGLRPDAATFTPSRTPKCRAAASGRGNKEEEVTLYVGNLGYATDEPSLLEAFGVFGELTRVDVARDKRRRPRGFALVTFSTRAAAELAVYHMDGKVLDGRKIRVNESKPKEGEKRPGFNAQKLPYVKLYVGNVPFESSRESVRRIFGNYGPVMDCYLPVDWNTGRFRGFALVTMPAKEAEVACRNLNGFKLDGRALKVNEAQPDDRSSVVSAVSSQTYPPSHRGPSHVHVPTNIHPQMGNGPQYNHQRRWR